jgi:pyruvate/2-oxoglutarate dehydrogenase complex dihydrolipoamide dehydrogenase (E3) component
MVLQRSSAVKDIRHMQNIEQYDALVLGTGEAGKYIAWHLAGKGKRTAVIERKHLGGSCPNVACLPSKNVIHSAKVASYFRRSEEFGIVNDSWRVDMAAVRARKRRMVDGLREMHLDKFAKSGAEIIMGSGRFVGERTLEVALLDGGVRVLQGKQVFLDTGTRATIDTTPGLTEASPLTHVEALELDTVPPHMLILGGGYVGLEFAQAMRRFGSRATVLERDSRLIPREDPDVSEALQQVFEHEGIEVLAGASVVRVEGRSGERVCVHLFRAGSEIALEGSHLLVATGRTPNTEGIGLDVAGIAKTERDYIQVNDRLETTAPGVWAMGDCAGSPQFTHIAFDDFRIVAENLAGGHRTTTGRQVPFCLFTDPELARVGLNESEAKRSGMKYRLSKIPIDNVLRARTLSETRGFLKALLNAENDQILGFAALAVGAGEMLVPVQLAMKAGLPYTALRDLIVTHPTMTEGFVSLFSAMPPIRDS